MVGGFPRVETLGYNTGHPLRGFFRGGFGVGGGLAGKNPYSLPKPTSTLSLNSSSSAEKVV